MEGLGIRGRGGRGRDRTESCGNLKDMWKRKREELERSREGKQIFRKSWRMERSPVKKKDMEGMVKESRKMLMELREEVKDQERRVREEMEEISRGMEKEERRVKERVVEDPEESRKAGEGQGEKRRRKGRKKGG